MRPLRFAAAFAAFGVSFALAGRARRARSEPVSLALLLGAVACFAGGAALVLAGG